MRHICAHPKQPQSPIDIIRLALRAAAIAPTMADALDVTGEALHRLAELSAAPVHSLAFNDQQSYSSEVHA